MHKGCNSIQKERNKYKKKQGTKIYIPLSLARIENQSQLNNLITIKISVGFQTKILKTTLFLPNQTHEQTKSHVKAKKKGLTPHNISRR